MIISVAFTINIINDASTSVIDDSRVMLQMEQRGFKNVNNWLYNKIYTYLETSGGQSYFLYLNVVHFFNTSGN